MRKGTGNILRPHSDDNLERRTEQAVGNNQEKKRMSSKFLTAAYIGGIIVVATIGKFAYNKVQEYNNMPELKIENEMYMLQKKEMNDVFDMLEDSLKNAREFYFEALDDAHEINVQNIKDNYNKRIENK